MAQGVAEITLPIDDSSFLASVTINQDEVNAAVAEVESQVAALNPTEEAELLVQALRLMDLTSLGNTDTKDTIAELCKQAVNPLPEDLQRKLERLAAGGSPITPAAVCVYPVKISDAKDALAAHSRPDFTVAAVAGAFPTGQFPLETRVLEVAISVSMGAKEIDIVIDRSLVLTQQWRQLHDEIHAMVSAAKTSHVKVILSTGELGSLENVYKASFVAMLAGAHFIKTSTGKESVNATLPVAVVMCQAIKSYAKQYHKKVGFKPAGGIRTHRDALNYMMAVKQQLGPEYLVPSLFRLGASTLLRSISDRLSELTKDWQQDA